MATFDALPKERRVERRARYLAATTDLSEREATAVAWSEEGYSWSGVAKQMDTSTGTVAKYYDRATAQYGLGAIGGVYGTRTGEEDFGAVTEEDLLDLPPRHVALWRKSANGHRERIPESVREYLAGEHEDEQNEQSDAIGRAPETSSEGGVER